MYYTYLIKCADGSFYCGYTVDLEKRFIAHTTGKGAKYTKSHEPQEIVYYEEFKTKSEAMSREWQIKKLSHVQKLSLIENMSKDKILSIGNNILDSH